MKVSTTAHKVKPAGREIAKLNKELVENKNVSLSPEELAGSVGQGHTVVLGSFDGERKVSNFTSTKYLGIDIDDSEATLEDTLALLEDLEITPSVYYHSFSADIEQGKHNHRVFIELDQEVGAREFKLLQLGLMKLIPQCDPACKDSVRIFFGTNKGAQYEEGATSVSHLLFLIKKYFYGLGRGARVREMKAFAQLTGVGMVNNQLDIGMDLTEVGWSITEEQAKALTKQTKRGPVYKKAELMLVESPAREYTQADFEELGNMFPLFGDFLKGEYWASYHELLFIASNMAFFHGGQKRFFEVIETAPWYDNETHTRDYYMFHLTDFLNRYTNPAPMRWTGEFEQYSGAGTNMVTAYRSSRQDYYRTGSEEKMELKQAQAQLKRILSEVQEADGGIHIVQVPTGLGKTTGITQMDYTSKRMGQTVVMLPTHDLIQQVSDSFYEEIVNGNQTVMPARSLERPSHLLEAQDKDKYDYLMAVGAYEQAGKFFNKAIKKSGRGDDDAVLDYKKAQVLVRTSHLSLTTHKMGLTQHFLWDVMPETVIIDEDPMMTLLNTNSIKISDLETLLSAVKSLPNSFYMVQWLEELLDALRVSQQAQRESMERDDAGKLKGEKFLGSVNKLEKPNFTTSHLLKKIEKWIVDGVYVFESPILELFNGGFWTINVETAERGITVASSFTLVQKPQFPAGAHKVIVFSATVSKTVWNQLYPEAKFYEVGTVQNKGTVKQHFINTSKTRLKENKDAIKDILKAEDIQNLITFKGTKGYFSEFQTEMHLGNTQGYNSLKGEDIAVAGTFSYPEHILNLIVFAVAGEYPENMFNYKLNINGFRFSFFTFSNPIHRALHTHIIESELQQAIGRARAIHFDCNVVVLSNFPVKEADEFYLGDKQLV